MRFAVVVVAAVAGVVVCSFSVIVVIKYIKGGCFWWFFKLLFWNDWIQTYLWSTNAYKPFMLNFNLIILLVVYSSPSSITIIPLLQAILQNTQEVDSNVRDLEKLYKEKAKLSLFDEMCSMIQRREAVKNMMKERDRVLNQTR